MNCNPPGSSIYGDSFFVVVFVFLFFCGDSLGRNTQVGSHALFQGIFLTQGLNLRPRHCRWILYHLNHQGSRITISTVNLCFFSVVVVMVCIILMKKECDLFHNCDLS